MHVDIFHLTHHIKYLSDIFKQLFFSLLSLCLPACLPGPTVNNVIKGLTG